jgi:cell division protein FtsN
MWLLAGILIGLGLAWYLAARGYIPQPQRDLPVAGEPAGDQNNEPVLPDESGNTGDQPSKPRYDFFTVLPEMEVVVPEQELAEQSVPETTATGDGSQDSYLLQVGSFKTAADADQMKAQLALTGVEASVQSVTVNDATWFRVRVGPVQGARQADEIRRRLQDNGIDSLVMKNP